MLGKSEEKSRSVQYIWWNDDHFCLVLRSEPWRFFFTIGNFRNKSCQDSTKKSKYWHTTHDDVTIKTALLVDKKKYIYMGYSKIYAYAYNRYALCFHISGVRMSVWRSITMYNTVYFVHFNGILWFRHCIFHPKTAQTRSCGAFENQVIDVANRQSEFEVN